MKKDLQVLVIIICDKNPEMIPDEKDVLRIRGQLEEVDGINETLVSPKSKSADIIAFASWEESEIESKVQEIKRIDGVKNVETKILMPV